MNEDAMKARGAAVLGVVLSVDDDGAAQTLTVQTHDGVIRSGVEVMSLHGLATNPGQDATALLIAVEGDQGHYVAIPCSLFGTRFGRMPAGGAALYDHGGNRLVFPGDGTGQLLTAGLMRMLVQSLLVQTQAGATFRGPVVFEDAVEFKSDVTMRGNLHVGGNITLGGAVTEGVSAPAPSPGAA